jgi:protein-tyrosine-phosphatase
LKLSGLKRDTRFNVENDELGVKKVSEIWKVVFVCQGNTCRSPMAEAIFRDLLKKNSLLDKVQTASFGVAAADGFSATTHAMEALKEYGISIDNHRSGSLTEENIAQAKLILAMTRPVKLAVKALVSEAEGKVYTLGEYAGEPQTEISDPIGGSLADYRKCRDDIKGLLIKAVERLKREIS